MSRVGETLLVEGKFSAVEPGFGITLSQVGSRVQVIVKTPFGCKAVHFTHTDGKRIGDAFGFASIDAQQAELTAAREIAYSKKYAAK